MPKQIIGRTLHATANKLRQADWLPNARVVIVLALVLFAGLCAVCDSANAGTINLVSNGSFEITTLASGSSGSYICGNSGSTTCISVITGWSSSCNGNCNTSSTVDSILTANSNGSAFNGGIGLWNTTNGGTGTVVASPDGGNYIAIDGDSTYGKPISQTVNGLVVGTAYTLTFYQAAAQQKGSGNGNPTTERWSVTLGGSPAQLSTLMTNPRSYRPRTRDSGTGTCPAAAGGGGIERKPRFLLDATLGRAGCPDPAS